MIEQPLGMQAAHGLDQAIDRGYGYTYERLSVADVFLRGLPDGKKDGLIELMEESSVDRVRRAAKRARGEK